MRRKKQWFRLAIYETWTWWKRTRHWEFPLLLDKIRQIEGTERKVFSYSAYSSPHCVLCESSCCVCAGEFGSGIVSYFRLMRFLIFFDIFFGIVWLLFVIGPQAIQFDYSVDITQPFYIRDLALARVRSLLTTKRHTWQLALITWVIICSFSWAARCRRKLGVLRQLQENSRRLPTRSGLLRLLTLPLYLRHDYHYALVSTCSV